ACMQHVNVGIGLVELGAYVQAENTIRRAMAAAERVGQHGTYEAARQNLGHALARLGRLDEAQALVEQAAAGFAAQQDRRMEGGCRIYLALVHVLAGRLDAAEREADAAVDVLATIAPLRGYALGMLARARLARGRAADALAAAESGMALLGEL